MPEELTYTRVHEALTADGLRMPKSTFLALMATGDIAEQMGVTGSGNRKGVPAASVELLRTFLPLYISAGSTPRAAPNLLRAHIQGRPPDAPPLVSENREPRNETSDIIPAALGQVAMLNARLGELVEAVSHAALSAPTEDRLIGGEEASELLHCRPRAVSRYVRPVRPGVFRRSDILRYIASLRTEI